MKMGCEQGLKLLAQPGVMLSVGLDYFGQAVIGQDQLPGRGILFIYFQHACFDDPRQITPVVKAVMVDGSLKTGAKRCMSLLGKSLEQCGNAGKEVIDRGRRKVCPFGDAIDTQACRPLIYQHVPSRCQNLLDSLAAAAARLAWAGGSGHDSTGILGRKGDEVLTMPVRTRRITAPCQNLIRPIQGVACLLIPSKT